MRDCGVELRPIAQIAAATTLDFLVCRDDRGVQTRCVLFDGFALRGHAEAVEALALRSHAIVSDYRLHFAPQRHASRTTLRSCYVTVLIVSSIRDLKRYSRSLIAGNPVRRISPSRLSLQSAMTSIIEIFETAASDSRRVRIVQNDLFAFEGVASIAGTSILAGATVDPGTSIPYKVDFLNVKCLEAV